MQNKLKGELWLFLIPALLLLLPMALQHITAWRLKSAQERTSLHYRPPLIPLGKGAVTGAPPRFLDFQLGGEDIREWRKPPSKRTQPQKAKAEIGLYSGKYYLRDNASAECEDLVSLGPYVSSGDGYYWTEFHRIDYAELQSEIKKYRKPGMPLVTGKGIQIGDLRQRVLTVLGNPSEALPGTLIYRYRGERDYTATYRFRNQRLYSITFQYQRIGGC